MRGPESLSTLLAEEHAWLRRLARSLVTDPSAAEDAAQETWLAALRHPEAARSRSWLARVLRNAVRQGRRAASRRADHEGRTTPREPAEAAVEVAAGLELRRRVLAAIEELEEPYRQAIALRFLDGLPPREVARRSRVPVRTVHGRVERGLARLRARLDAAYRDRSAWVALLLPLARPRTLGFLGGLAMGTTWSWIAVGCGALALALGWRLGAGSEPARPAVVPRAERSASSEPPVVTPPDADSPRRAVASAGEPAALAEAREERPPAPEPPAFFEGRVVDLLGRPVEGVAVFADVRMHVANEVPREERSARTGAGGRFRMKLPPESHPTVLDVESESWASVVRPGLAYPPPEPPVIVVARARTVAGRVTDGEGVALERVRLALLLPDAVRERLPGVTELEDLGLCSSLADGTFLLPRMPEVPGAVLAATRNGYAPRTLEIPWPECADLRLRLEAEPRGSVSGTVVDGRGDPVEDAWVGWRDRTARSDREGRYVLEDVPYEDGLALVAIRTGFAPARRTLDGREEALRRDVLLVVEHEPLSIGGRVVDAEGRPVPGARVWTFDGEPFGAGSPASDGARPPDVEDLMADGMPGRSVVADGEGRFTLLHLVDRNYSVHAWHPETLETVRVDGVAAGTTGLRLPLAGRDPTVPVAGRVTLSDGSPLAGAKVRVLRFVPVREGEAVFRAPEHEFGAVTDEAGRFRFEALALRGTHVYVNAEGLPVPPQQELERAADPEHLLFVLPAPCFVRVRLADPARADGFTLLRADGTRLPLSFQAGGTRLGADRVRIVAGESPVTWADDSARELVLLLGDAEVQRLPVRLGAGELNELDL